MDGLLEIFNENGFEDSYSAMRDVYDEYTSETKKYEAVMINANALSNRVVRDYEMNCKQAKIRCIQESGTEDDYNFFVESASMAASQKLRSVIEKIIAFWKELVAKITHIIQTKVCSVEAKMYVKKIEKEIAINPTLGKMKVQVVDNTKYIGLLQKTRSKLDTYDAMLVAGFSGKVKMGTFGTTVEDIVSAVGNIPVATAVMTTMTVSALLTSIMLDMDKLPLMIKDLDERSSVILKRFMSVVDDEVGATAIGAFQQAANFRVQLNKQECDTRIQWVIDKIGTLKEALRNAQGVGTVNMNVNEEADDNFLAEIDTFLEETDEIFTEALFDMNDRLQDKYKSAVKKITHDLEKATEAKKRKDIKAMGKYIGDAEKDIDDAIKAIEGLGKYEVGANIIGSILHTFAIIGKTIYTRFCIDNFYGLIGGVTRNMKDWGDVADYTKYIVTARNILEPAIAEITAMAKAIATGKFNIGTINIYRAKLVQNIRMYKLALGKLKMQYSGMATAAITKTVSDTLKEESGDDMVTEAADINEVNDNEFFEDTEEIMTENADELDDFLTKLIESAI